MLSPNSKTREYFIYVVITCQAYSANVNIFLLISQCGLPVDFDYNDIKLKTQKKKRNNIKAVMLCAVNESLLNVFYDL